MEMTTDELFRCVCATASDHAMFPPDAPVILMVSGGSDSIALLHVMAALRGRLGVGAMRVMHLNHMLRGADADTDEAFVKEVASTYDIPVLAYHEDIAAMVASEHGNMEDIARRERYRLADAALDDLCAELSRDRHDGRIVVAHTEDDRTETFFMRSIVGAGPGSLASIPYLSGRVARPLLNLSRDDLRGYLIHHVAACAGAAHGAAPRLEGCAMVVPVAGRDDATMTLWREDATNADITRFRAFVRSRIVPLARTFNPRLSRTVCRSLDLLGEEDAMLDEQATAMLAGISHTDDDGTLLLDVAGLSGLPLPMQRRVVRKAAFLVVPDETRLDAFHIDTIVQHGADAGFVTVLPGSTVVGNEYGKLAFRKTGGDIDVTRGGWLELPGTFDLGDSRIIEATIVDDIPDVHHAGRDEAYLDIGALPRLWVRNPHPGERICPLGMGGRSRKISDVLIDRKVPARLRPRVPLVTTGPGDDDDSVWLAGLVVDERYRVRPTTADCVLLTLRVCSDAAEN